MKKLFPLAVAMFFTGILAAQSIPNGGFENWTATTWLDPQYYITSNDPKYGNGQIGAPPNITQTTGKYGTYGVQIETIAYQGDTIGGFAVDANPNNNRNGLSGGIPYAQKPTGIRFWYKYTTSGVDTAAIMAIFKKSGSMIDSFLIAIPSSASTSTYTLHSYYPSHALSVTPDTVVFGAVSSIEMVTNQNHRTNKGILPGSTLTIDSVTFTGVSSQPAELNGNFENWVADSILTPSGGWYVSYPNVTRTTDAESGAYALQLQTSEVDSVGQAEASTGYWPNNCNNNCHQMGGKAYTVPISEKDTLWFSYKYAPTLNDTANISLSFIYHGQNVYMGNPMYLTKTITTYKDTFMALNFGSTLVDTVIVDIVSSWHNNTNNYSQYSGSTLKIDKMYFSSQEGIDLGLNNLSKAEEIKVYPNPARNQISIDLSNVSGNLQTINLYDMSGRLLNSQSYPGGMRNNIENLNLSGFSPGIYLIEVTTDNGKFYQKVCKD